MRRRRRGAWSALLGAVGLVVSSACGEADEGGRTHLPASAPVLRVAMDEYRFQHDRAVPAGRVVFRARNVGRIPHLLTVVPLSEDLPPIQEQLRGTERRFIDPVAGIYERRPGSTGTFAVDLTPGQRYALICFVVDPDDKSHAIKGMTSEFRAGERSSSA